MLRSIANIRNRIARVVGTNSMRAQSVGSAQSQLVGDGYDGLLQYFASRLTNFNLDDTGLALAVSTSTYAYRATDTRASVVARIPMRVYRKGAEKPEEGDTPFSRALDWAMIAYEQDLIYNHIFSLITWGENYEEKLIRAGDGLPGGLRWLNPLAIEPFLVDGVKVRYDYDPGVGGIVHYELDEIGFHKMMNPRSDIRGLSPMGLALDSVNIRRQMIRYILAFFANDTKPGGVLSVRQGSTISANEQDKAIEQWKEQNKGVNNSHKTVMIPYPLEFQALQSGIPTQQLELSDDQKTTIADAIDVPLSLVGNVSVSDPLSAVGTMTSTIASWYERRIFRDCEDVASYYNRIIMPWLDPDYEVRPDFSEIKALIQQNAEYAGLVRADLNGGLITLNQALEARGYETRANGDIYYIPASVTVTKAEELGEQQLPPAPAQSDVIIESENMAGQESDGEGEATSESAELPAPDVAGQLPDGSKLSLRFTKSSEGVPEAFVVLSMPHNEVVSTIRDRLLLVTPDMDNIRWVDPDYWHITLVYAKLIGVESLYALLEGIRFEIENLSVLPVTITGSDVFLNDGVQAYHLTVEKSPELIDLQSRFFEAFDRADVPMSEFSQPAQWTPHITLAYVPEEVEFPKLTGVAHTSANWVEVSRGAYHQQYDIHIHKRNDVLEHINLEVKAWRDFLIKRVGKKSTRDFVIEHIPTDLVDEIKANLLGYEDDPEHIKAVFNTTLAILRQDKPTFSDHLQATKMSALDDSALSDVIRRFRELGFTELTSEIDELVGEDTEDSDDIDDTTGS